MKKSVKEFYIEESKVNKGMLIMVAVAEDGSKYVVGGDPYNTPAVIPYNQCWDAIGQDEYKKLTTGGK